MARWTGDLSTSWKASVKKYATSSAAVGTKCHHGGVHFAEFGVAFARDDPESVHAASHQDRARRLFMAANAMAKIFWV